jgi:hypothetical protein
MKKFEVVKNDYKWSNYLLIANDCNSGLRIDTVEEMRQIAKALIEKADEIDPQVIGVCPSCKSNKHYYMKHRGIFFCTECQIYWGQNK